MRIFALRSPAHVRLVIWPGWGDPLTNVPKIWSLAIRRRHLLALAPAVPILAATRPAHAAPVDHEPRRGQDLDLRVMVWNVRSSTLAGIDPDMTADVGLENRRQLIEFLRERNPDVLFMIETYGSGEAITAGLNAGRPLDQQYAGVQITEGRDDPSAHRDNLWLFTRLPILEKFPTINETVTSSFNFGGVRAELPDGRTICLFSSWLWHEGWAWGWADDAVWDATHGLPARYTPAEVASADEGQRQEMATTILQERIPSFVADGELVLLGGDFNTMSHLDWDERFADAPGHAGLAFDWPVTAAYADAGFTDLFRTVHPDAGRFPGATWSPSYGTGMAPGRIDYAMARGAGITPVAARSDVRRLDRHEDFTDMAQFPFYSDHGSVTVDVRIAGAGQRPWGALKPLPAEAAWTPDEEPKGEPIPAAEIVVTASSELDGNPASNALDGDATTMWHSAKDADAGLPQSLRLDLGRRRLLSALRYVPRQRYNGIITHYEVRTSVDGRRFTTRGRGEFGNTSMPSVVPLRGRARYVELIAHHGYADFASAVEVEVYGR